MEEIILEELAKYLKKRRVFISKNISGCYSVQSSRMAKKVGYRIYYKNQHISVDDYDLGYADILKVNIADPECFEKILKFIMTKPTYNAASNILLKGYE